MNENVRGKRTSATRHRKWLHRAVTVPTVFGMMTLFAAAGTGAVASAANKKAAKQLTKFNIVYAAPVTSMILPVVTQKAGLFKKYGITATVQYLEVTSAKDELVSNAVQGVVSAAPVPELLRSEGYSAKWVATWLDKATLYLLCGAGIKSISGLATKTVGQTTPDSPTTIMGEILFKKAGILTSVHMQPLGSPPAWDAAFEAGSVADDITGPPASTKMLKTTPGSSVCVNMAKMKTFDWITGGMAMMTTWALSHKKATIDVMKALAAGLKYMENPKHETAVLKVIETATHITRTTAIASYKHTMPAMAKNGSMVPSLSVEKVLLKEYASVTSKMKDVNPGAVIAPKYMKVAYKKLKKK